MRLFKDCVKATLICSITGVLIMGSTMLALDSYELELTGQCKQCIVLQYIKPSI